MKKTINVNIGGSAFTMDEDAHSALSFYLSQISARISASERTEVMEDVEMRIAALLTERLPGSFRVVDMAIINSVISVMGPAYEFGEEQRSYTESTERSETKSTCNTQENRFFRSRTNRMFGGICGSLSSLLKVDVSIIRIVLFIAMLGSASALFWVYIVGWLIIPEEPIDPQYNNKAYCNERK